MDRFAFPFWQKSGANLIIFPEKSAKNLSKISPLLRWPAPEVMQESLLPRSGCLP